MDWSNLAYFAFVAAFVILMMEAAAAASAAWASEVATIRAQATNDVVMITPGRRHRKGRAA